MGALFAFRCPSCGYQATVSGGPDVGMACATTTIACKTCKNLLDVVTHDFDLGNFPPGDMENLEGTAAPLECPKGKAHVVEPWTAGGPCPRCGTDMGEGELEILWD